ncbi:MAG: sulfurtransferase complex subunit TusB [Magnetospirillum sp.]|nr:sulfurtransferase complex subunit TusB [Magnetospirillum sp.]
MSTLHTVNKSPFERANLDACLGHALPGDAILLIEDGVFAAMKATNLAARMTDAAKTFKLYALAADLKARGMDPANVVDGCTVVDYAGFVDLAAANSAVNAWL